MRLVPRPLVTTLTVAATGPASLAEVWDKYTLPVRWPQWSPQIRGVEVDEPARRVAAGTRGVVRGPGGVRVPFEVTAVDTSLLRWTWRVRVGLVPLQLGHGVDDRPEGTRAWVRITGPLPLVLGYAPASRLALGRLVGDADR